MFASNASKNISVRVKYMTSTLLSIFLAHKKHSHMVYGTPDNYKTRMKKSLQATTIAAVFHRFTRKSRSQQVACVCVEGKLLTPQLQSSSEDVHYCVTSASGERRVKYTQTFNHQEEIQNVRDRQTQRVSGTKASSPLSHEN